MTDFFVCAAFLSVATTGIVNPSHESISHPMKIYSFWDRSMQLLSVLNKGFYCDSSVHISQVSLSVPRCCTTWRNSTSWFQLRCFWANSFIRSYLSRFLGCSNSYVGVEFKVCVTWSCHQVSSDSTTSHHDNSPVSSLLCRQWMPGPSPRFLSVQLDPCQQFATQHCERDYSRENMDHHREKLTGDQTQSPSATARGRDCTFKNPCLRKGSPWSLPIHINKSIKSGDDHWTLHNINSSPNSCQCSTGMQHLRSSSCRTWPAEPYGRTYSS